MKILIQQPKEFNLTLQGLKAAFVILENCIYWNPEEKNIYDIYHEYNPDIIIYDHFNLKDEAIFNLQREQKNNSFKLVSIYYNDIFNTTYSINYFNGKQEANNEPLALDHEQYNSITHILKPAANAADYGRGVAKPEYQCDYLLFNNIENPQNTDIEKVLNNISIDSLKIFGKYPLNYPQYIGQLTNYEMSCAIKSCEIFIDVDHCMFLDMLYNKKQYHIMKEIELVPPELRQLVNESNSFIEDGYKYAKQNTYFHRAIEILKNLDYNDVAEKATITMDNFLNSLENK
jgi:hypothetical protein